MKVLRTKTHERINRSRIAERMRHEDQANHPVSYMVFPLLRHIANVLVDVKSSKKIYMISEHDKELAKECLDDVSEILENIYDEVNRIETI